MCKSKAVNIDNDPLVIGRSHSDTIKKISHPKNEVASLSFFHLRAIFYGANIGIHFITPKNDDNFSHIAMNFKTISTPTQRKRSLQPPIVRPRPAHLPKRAGAREAGGARGGPHGGTERHNRRTAPALARTTSFRPKKGGANGSSLGHFFDLSGSVPPIAPTASAPTPPQEARAEKPAKKLSHARTTPSFCFFPSPIDSNSVVHNALRVKISNILTQRKQPTTTSASTPCR